MNEKYNNFIMKKWNDFLRKRFIHLSSEKSDPRLKLIGYRDPQSSIIFLLMGIFDWPITKIINETLNHPKIDML
jgi:hypothetical protein